jgi:hypothetical protein
LDLLSVNAMVAYPVSAIKPQGCRAVHPMSSTGLQENARHSGAGAARTRNLAPQLRDSGFVLSDGPE